MLNFIERIGLYYEKNCINYYLHCYNDIEFADYCKC